MNKLKYYLIKQISKIDLVHNDKDLLSKNNEKNLYHFLGNLEKEIDVYHPLNNNENIFYVKIIDIYYLIEEKIITLDEIIEKNTKIMDIFSYKQAIRYENNYMLFNEERILNKKNHNDVLLAISYALRGSHTLDNLQDEQKLINQSLEFIVSKRGIYCFSPFAAQRKKILINYLLVLTYLNKCINFINEAANCNKDKDYLKIRTKVLEFEIKHFFNNPVKYNRYELYDIYEMIATFYKVKEIKNELKEQIKDIAKMAQINIEENKINHSTLFEWLIIIITIFSLIPAVDSFNTIFDVKQKEITFMIAGLFIILAIAIIFFKYKCKKISTFFKKIKRK